MPSRPPSANHKIIKNEEPSACHFDRRRNHLSSGTPSRGREEVDRDLLSQSRSQESVGRSVQSTVADLESLLADLESNGLIEENMIEKMRDAKQALNSIGEENIPAVTEKIEVRRP